MAAADDLIDFSIIETQKENIQAIPSGRSAKALASVFSPVALKSPSITQDKNGGIRQLYEQELLKVNELDDPLDVYDRYVKWTLNAYPSAQATPQSQLLPLLERATKAFIASPQYKNDLRYLRLWLHYIRFFSDAPREHFAYLARHNIGDGLALYYEEFAAWLESAGRWTQAEEVFSLGVDKAARPAERLLRKYAEFQHRFESRPKNDAEPSSPALPTVRPALAAKLDPFAPAAPQDPHAQAASQTAKSSRKPKLEIFSDSADDARPSSGDSTRGWEHVGTLAERKKENVIGATSWTGEKLEGGRSNIGVPKMMVFKDQFSLASSINPMRQAASTVNPKTGRTERVFVNLEAVYPDPSDPRAEYCFEELRAAKRGWLQRDWSVHARSGTSQSPVKPSVAATAVHRPASIPLNDENNENAPPSREQREADVAKKIRQEEKANRTRKIKIREVRGETQTIQTNLSSPQGPKLKRKKSAEPTMTLHTRAATDEVYELFNQPLKSQAELDGSASEEESDDEDDYTSGGESTGTGHISNATSEFGDETQDNITEVQSVTEEQTKTDTAWSDFTTSKHVPHTLEDETVTTDAVTISERLEVDIEAEPTHSTFLDNNEESNNEAKEQEEITTPVSPTPQRTNVQTSFVPIPPEDFEYPTRPYRDAAQRAQDRLPFMTPIVEKTESSLGTITAKRNREEFVAKTPCPKSSTPRILESGEEPWSSPFQEVLDEVVPTKLPQPVLSLAGAEPKAAPKSISKTGFKDIEPKSRKGPIIQDMQCNPMDQQIRDTILQEIHPPLATYEGYFDHTTETYGKSTEIRKFCKATSSKGKHAGDGQSPPVLNFPGAAYEYTIRRQVGEGAFAPVFLAEHDLEEVPNSPSAAPMMRKGAFVGVPRSTPEAIKMELDPPSAWEFYILRTAKRRLGVARAAESIIDAHEMHLFADEGYLIERYCDQGTLLDLVNAGRALTASEGGSPGGIDEIVAMWFAVELFRTVEALHKQGIIHGDLKADNVLLRLDDSCSSTTTSWSPVFAPNGTNGWSGRGITLIDFGRGIDMRAFPAGAHFIADWTTTDADCPEMRELRPWTFHADYYGLACILHTLLFGRYLETTIVTGAGSLGANSKTYRVKESMKRWWQADLWNGAFGVLLNPAQAMKDEDGACLPLLKSLKGVREGMEKWLVENGERGIGLRGGLRRLEGALKERRRA